MADEKRNLVAELREQFGHGHKEFIPVTLSEIELHSKKNADYARGGNPLDNFDRRAELAAIYKKRGHPIDLSDPVQVAVWDSLKQVDAALWMLTGGYEGAVEGVESRFGDVSVLNKLARIMYRDKREVNPIEDVPTEMLDALDLVAAGLRK